MKNIKGPSPGPSTTSSTKSDKLEAKSNVEIKVQGSKSNVEFKVQGSKSDVKVKVQESKSDVKVKVQESKSDVKVKVQEAKPDVKINFEINESASSMKPPISKVKSKVKVSEIVGIKDRDGKTRNNFLGNDLLPPPQSEFKLKRNLDPADRGRPMIDWIRRQSLSDSGNYSMKSPSKAEISLEQLQQHNTPKDGWLALRGQVYNVTDYISYHPGGVKEIMKGVGKDATALFNAIHRYVNFESILKGKQVGFFGPNRQISQSVEGSQLSSNPGTISGESHCCCFPILSIGCCEPKVQEYDDVLTPNTKFHEDNKFCFYQIDLKGYKYNQDYWTASILSKDILLLKVVTSPPDIWVAHYKLREALINDTIHIAFTNRARTMTVKLEKPRQLSWKSLGEALPDSNLILDSRQSIEDMTPCTLVIKQEIAHDFYLMAFEVNPSARIGVPVGFDVKVTAVNSGISRRYTPISLLFPKSEYQYKSSNEVLYFVIKIYPEGKMTQTLVNTPLNTTELLKIGYSSGNFNSDWLHGVDFYFLFAAGSGITPYLRILDYYKEHNIALGVSRVIIVHWSKEMKDIIWRTEFEEMQKKIKWFKFIPVLTQVADDDKSWEGLRGRISTTLLTEIIDKAKLTKKKKNQFRFMTCGPEGFNVAVCESLETSGYPLDSAFIFLG